jgi:hypothetical protein
MLAADQVVSGEAEGVIAEAVTALATARAGWPMCRLGDEQRGASS